MTKPNGKPKKPSNKERVLKFFQKRTDKLIKFETVAKALNLDVMSVKRALSEMMHYENHQFINKRGVGYVLPSDQDDIELVAKLKRELEQMGRVDHLNQHQIIKGAVFTSKKFGQFEIEEYRNSLEVDIVFIETRDRRTVTASQVRSGNCRDYSKGVRAIEVGDVFPTTKSGDIKVIKMLQHPNLLVEFLKTGNQKVTHKGAVKKGAVLDKDARPESSTVMRKHKKGKPINCPQPCHLPKHISGINSVFN